MVTSELKELPSITNRVIYRILKEDDLLALEWEGEFRHFRRVYENAFDRMKSGKAVHWVADMTGICIVGQIFVQLECDRPELANGKERAYFYSFRVRPQYRGFGIGSKLLGTVELDLRSRGVKFLTCNVGKENHNAQRFYSRHGYEIRAHEPGIWSYQDENGLWHDIVEPAWRMEKMLSNP